MGVSTDGLFWYGMCDDGSAAEESEGLPDSVVEKMKTLGYAFEDQYELVDVINELIADHGCELVAHCSDGNPMYGLAVKQSLVTAWRGSPQQLAAPAPCATGWEESVVKACEAIGWPSDAAPSFWLASWWS